MKPATREFLRQEDEAARASVRRAQSKGSKTMAFAIRDLSVLAYANGFTLWHYKAHDITLLDVSAPDFFAEAADMMAFGDVVVVSARDGGTSLYVTKAQAHSVHTTAVAVPALGA